MKNRCGAHRFLLSVILVILFLERLVKELKMLDC
jgi:hypothetical protein